MKNKIKSQKEFIIGDRTFIINLYDAGDQKYGVNIFEKVESNGKENAVLSKNGATIKSIPFHYLKGA